VQLPPRPRVGPQTGPLPPIFFVCGAFASGKSTTADLVAVDLKECLVLDVDWLLASLRDLARLNLSKEPGSWPDLRNVWLSIASLSARSGRPSVLFLPSLPDEIETLTGRSLVGEGHWLLLDCNDNERVARLRKRETWQPDWTMEVLEEADRFRRLGFESVPTDRLSPEEAAAAVSRWVRAQL
jgi:hypothetical protein